MYRRQRQKGQCYRHKVIVKDRLLNNETAEGEQRLSLKQLNVVMLFSLTVGGKSPNIMTHPCHLHDVKHAQPRISRFLFRFIL